MEDKPHPSDTSSPHPWVVELIRQLRYRIFHSDTPDAAVIARVAADLGCTKKAVEEMLWDGTEVTLPALVSLVRHTQKKPFEIFKITADSVRVRVTLQKDPSASAKDSPTSAETPASEEMAEAHRSHLDHSVEQTAREFIQILMGGGCTVQQDPAGQPHQLSALRKVQHVIQILDLIASGEVEPGPELRHALEQLALKTSGILVIQEPSTE